MTIIILLSLYNLRDARVLAASGSPVRISGEGKDAATVVRYNATGYTSSVSHAAGNEQEGAKELKGQAVKLTDPSSHTPGNEQDTAKVPENHAATSLSNTPGNEQNTAKVPANIVSSSTIAATSAIDVAIPSTAAAPNEPRRAFVTFLEADTGTNHADQEDGTNPDNEDIYFVGALYQRSNLIFSNH